MSCHTSWPPASDVNAQLPAVSPTHTGIAVQGIAVTLDYFIQIHSN